VYSICKKTYNDGADGSHLCTEYTDLLADKYSIQSLLVCLSAVHILLTDCLYDNSCYQRIPRTVIIFKLMMSGNIEDCSAKFCNFEQNSGFCEIEQSNIMTLLQLLHMKTSFLQHVSIAC